MIYSINSDYKLSATTVDNNYPYYKIINDIRILVLWLMLGGIDKSSFRHENLN